MVLKRMVLKISVRLFAPLFITVASFIMMACTSGPVPVRDIAVPPNSQPAVQPGQSAVSPSDVLEMAPSIVQPDPAPLPLNDNLKQQAEQSLQQQRWQQAILVAERGLRINRKDPFFYWVLSTAYRQLSEIQKSIDFARQGLRYIVDDKVLKRELTSLATQ